MSDKQEENKKGKVQADDQSIAIGSIDVGGDVSGNITIGNTIGYTADDVSVLIKEISTTFQPKPFDGRSPYKGLDVFEEEDADLFFGREKIVDNLVERVKESRTVFITGPSGSGKSSLVRAGLIPALKQGGFRNSERWLYETVKPGRDPVETLALAFSRLKSPELGKYFRENVHQSSVLHECAESALSGRKDQRLVLFFDQFEEIFTQVAHEEARAAFLELLTHAATVEDGRVVILFAMRSDFVSNCATYPKLNSLLNEEFVQIGAMGSNELVSAIAQPALRVGLRIDPDLVAQIINDMQGEPGALPLMQFALKDLFEAEQVKGGVIALTREAYLQRGGIQKSLERHADASFAKLEKHEQELARSIFGGLIEIGRGTQDTRRTALFDELIPASSSVEEIETIVQKLADARLITTDELAGKDMVTISHEKLIDAWPWLKHLVDENRDVIALQNQIATDAREWEAKKRDPSYLYSGGRLANAHEQLETKKLALSGLAQEFVRAGHARQRRRQIALILGISTVITLLIISVVVFSRQSSANAQLAEENISIANTAQARSTEIALQRDDAQKKAEIAFSRQLAAQSNAIQNQFPLRSLLLSIEALNVTENFGLPAEPAVIDGLIQQLSSIDGIPLGSSTTMSMDGNWLAVFAPEEISLLNLRVEDPLSSKTTLTNEGRLKFSPNSQRVAICKEDGSILVWDLTAASIPDSLLELQGPTDGFYTNGREPCTFNPNGGWLAGLDNTKNIWLWNLEQSQSPLTLTEAYGQVNGFRFSPDNRWLLIWGIAISNNQPDTGKKAAALWSLEDLSQHDLDGYINLAEDQVSADYRFSPDGKWLFTKQSDGGTNQTFWDLSEIEPKILEQPQVPVLQYDNQRITGFTPNLWAYHIETVSPLGQTYTYLSKTENFPEQAHIWDGGGYEQQIVISPNGYDVAIYGKSSNDPYTDKGFFNLLDLYDIFNPGFNSDPFYYEYLSYSSTLSQKPDSINAVAFSSGSGKYLGSVLADTGEIYLWGSDKNSRPIKFLGWEAGRFSSTIDLPDWYPPLSTGNFRTGDLAISEAGWLTVGGRLYDIRKEEYGLHPFSASSYPESLPTTGFFVKASPQNQWLLTWYPAYQGNISKKANPVEAGPGYPGLHIWNLDRTDYRYLPFPFHYFEWVDDPLVFSPDEKWLSIAHETDIYLWNLLDFDKEDDVISSTVLTGPKERISALVFSKDGQWLAVSSWDGKVRLWKLGQEGVSEQPITLEGAPPLGPIALSPDGRWLLAGGAKGTIYAWNLQDDQIGSQPLHLGVQENPIFNLQFSPDGEYFVAGTYNEVILYKVSSQEIKPEPIELKIVVYDTEAHERIDAISFSPDSKWLVAKDKLWKLENLIADPESAPLDVGYAYTKDVIFSPDSNWLVTIPTIYFDYGYTFPFPADIISTGGGGFVYPPLYDTVQLWDLNESQQTPELTSIVIPVSGITSFSPDSHWLAIGTHTKAQIIDLFSLTENKSLQPIELPDSNGYLSNVTFTPDGRYIISGLDIVEEYANPNRGLIPQVMYKWDLDYHALRNLACQRAGRNLTRSEWAQYFVNRTYHITCPQWLADE